MEVEVFLHGTPKGYNFIGKSDEFSYCSTFYTNQNENEKLVVELKNMGNATFCYYTYIKSRNVNSADSRPGGYIALTVRLDNYCRDTIAFYFILKSLYKKHVVGNFVQEVGDTTKYIVESLSSKEGELDNMMRALVQLLSLQIPSTEFARIRCENIPSQNGAMQLNLLDCTNESVLNAIKKSGKVSVSMSYPSVLERDLRMKWEKDLEYRTYKFELELHRLQTEHNRIFEKYERADKERHVLINQNEELKKSIADFDNRVKKLSNEANLRNEELHYLRRKHEGLIEQYERADKERHVLEREKEGLKARIADTEVRIKNLSKSADLRNEITKISDPLLRLNGLLQRFGISPTSQSSPLPHQMQLEQVLENRMPSKKSAKLTVFFSFMAVVLLLVVMTFQFILVFRDNSLPVGEKAIETIPEQKLIEEKEISPEPTVVTNLNNMRINIREYHGKGPLQYDREYSLYISNKGHYNRPDSIKELRWECDGGKIYQNGENEDRLRLKKKNGPVKIICRLPNGESIERVIEVSSDEVIKVPYSDSVPKMKKNEKSIPLSIKQNQASFDLKG